MASGFGSSAAGPSFGGTMNMQQSGSNAQLGPDLEQIETEGLGFSAFSGESKVQLLSTPWPADALPPPTSSLLSTASSKGLLAAAGPDVVIIATMDSVRAAFSGKSVGDTSLKAFEPQLLIPVSTRVSQIAFSADETCLAISAEQGGGLAVYDVGSLLQGNKQPAFELSTNGVSLRAVVPNPSPATAELFAVVTTNGQLMMANLKERQFSSGPSGQVIKDGVSCVSWSAKGKQLVAGMGNGLAHQMTPSGEGKSDIPLPPGMEGEQHMSSISWLENDIFLLIHTPTSFDADSIPNSTFHLVTRHAQSGQFLYQRVTDPCPPFGLNRSPPFHFILRLRNFEPNLKDMLIISSTGSTDVGLITRSSTPLSGEAPAENIVNKFTTTGLANDARRAQLPMTEEANDTSAVGVAMDLSSKEPVDRPIPGEEIDKSATPLPALMILNNEGCLVAWWVVYAESIRQGTRYSGLVGALSSQQSQSQQNLAPPSPFGAGTTPQQPAFGQSSFGNTATPDAFNSLSKPSAPSFGSSSFGAPAFGSQGSGSGFGNKASVWGTPNTPAQPPSAATPGPAPTFGSSTPIASRTGMTAFGQSGGLGNRSSPWAAQQAQNAFNPESSSDKKDQSPFSGHSGGSSGFGAYANKGGFGSALSATPGTGLFGKSENATPFGSGMEADTAFGKPESQTTTNDSAGIFSGTRFRLGSTFTGDDSAKADVSKPAGTGENLFGDGFGDALGEAAKDQKPPEISEADMDAGSEDDRHDQPTMQEPAQSTTPLSTPAPPKFQFPGAIEGAKNDFSSTSKPDHSDPSNRSPESEAVSNNRADNQTALATMTTDSEQTRQASPPSPKVKPEPEDGEHADTRHGIDKNIPEAPLPPESTSKASYAAGESSSSSASTNVSLPEDAPLPPDFASQKEVPANYTAVSAEVPISALDDSELDEGSGEDVAQDLSPASDRSQSLKATPQSSFRDSSNRSPVGGLFTHIQRPDSKHSSRPLFGEIGKGSMPHFPPPMRVQESPRSPSPVRQDAQQNLMKPENARSTSAPGAPHQLQAPKKSAIGLARQAQTQPAQPEPTFEQEREISRSVFQKQQEEEEQDLSDREDERVRQELASDIEGTLVLDPFIAHQDYVGQVDKEGIPGQIERVYRDINSMIDTLGLNARSLKSFVKGHSEKFKEGGRSREDLEIEDDWCLVEIQDLGIVENELGEQLENGRVTQVSEKISLCNELQRDLGKVRAKHDDVKKILDAHSDPDKISAMKSAPLSNEQGLQQRELRKDFAEFQTMLTDLEDGVSLLNAKLAANDESKGMPGGRAMPTVEAVINTVTKMTGMVEKRSGDVDVLENHLRKLKLSSPINGGSLEGTSQRASHSPRVTPTRFSGSGRGGQFSTPQSARSTPRGLGSSAQGASPLSQSINGSATRRPVNQAAAEDMAKRYEVAKVRRVEVTDKLRDALAKKGPRIQTIDD